MQVDSTNYVSVHGKIPVGECTFTSSGNLKSQGIKYVIHTVGPQFSEGEPLLPQQMLLYNSVFNAFKAANALGCRSIAIPAISSGIYAFPVGLCAQIIFNAISDFIKLQQKKTGHDTWLKHFRVVNWD